MGQEIVLVRKKKALPGITLVELLLSLFIGVVVFGALLSLINYTSTLSEIARNKVNAMNAARQKIEQFKSDVQINFDNAVTEYTNNTKGPVFTPVGVNGRGRITLNAVAGGGGDLFDVTVVICWRQRNNRVIGEDSNLNGQLNAGEDTNGNGALDSPCTLTTAIRRAN